MRKVIIDTDPGIDDAIALMTIFKQKDVEVLGLCSVAGNKGIELTTSNASKIANYCQYPGKVYRGLYADIESVLKNEPPRIDKSSVVHGKDGLGDVDFPIDESNIADQSAVDFILETVKNNPHEVDLICLGPLSNIAMCIEKDLETMEKVKSIYTMGGGVHRGNVTPVAEFNYWFDPAAVNITFNKLGPYVPIYMIGLDVTHQVLFDMNEVAFFQFEGGEVGKLIAHMTKPYVETYWQNNKVLGIIIHDLTTVLAYLYPEILPPVKKANVQCVADENIAKGQCIVDFSGRWTKEKNVFVPMEIDVETCKKIFIELLFGKDVLQRYVDHVLTK